MNSKEKHIDTWILTNLNYKQKSLLFFVFFRLNLSSVFFFFVFDVVAVALEVFVAFSISKEPAIDT